jgi:hypothetical protein
MEILIMALAVGVPLLLVIAYQGLFIHDLMKAHDANEKDLLDRIMARNYEVFTNAEVLRAEADRKPLTLDEIHQLQMEQGIPV